MGYLLLMDHLPLMDYHVMLSGNFVSNSAPQSTSILCQNSQIYCYKIIHKTSQDVLTKIFKQILKTGNCTRKSDINYFMWSFIQLIYAVTYSLYPWPTLADILKSFWATESLRIKEEPIDFKMSPEPVLIIVRFVHEWYEVGLLWFKENSKVPDHYNLCFN